VGHLVAADEEEINTKVYLPSSHILAGKPKLMQKKQGDPGAIWAAFTGDAEVAIIDGGAAFDWSLHVAVHRAG